MSGMIELVGPSSQFALVTVFGVLLLSLLSFGIAKCFRRHPAIRHNVLCSSLIACLACPVIALLVSAAGRPVLALSMTKADGLRERAEASRDRESSPRPGDALAERGARDRRGTDPRFDPDFPASLRHADERESNSRPEIDPPRSGAAIVSRSAAWRSKARAISWVSALTFVWLLGSLCFLVMTVRGLIGLRRMILGALPVESDSVQVVSRQAAKQVGLTAVPPLLHSTCVRVPAVVGYRKMSVILPPELLTVTDDDELRSVLIHEFAHVKRRDPLVVLLQTLARGLFWPILSIHWLDRDLSRAREEICDNYVLRQTTTHAYGQTLLKLGQLALGARSLSPSVGILNWRGKLEHRIAGFLHSKRSYETATSLRWFAAPMMIALTLATVVSGTRWVQADQESASNDAKHPMQDAEAEANSDHLPARPALTLDPRKSGSFQTKIVDGDGNPVAGAKVELWQVAFGGGSGSPDKAYLQPQISDEQGSVRIPYPKSLGDNGKLRTLRLGLRVRHEKYPTWWSYLPVDQREPIRLPTPVWATIAVNLPGGVVVASDLVAQTSGQQPGCTMIGPTLRVGPLDLTSERPSNLMRIIHAPEDGPVFLSELIDLTPIDRPGNEISLATVLHPAATVTGQLSDNVPRPVTGGVVIAKTIRGPAMGAQWIWSGKADIAADGSFTLTGIPRDEHLQLIAICDGWVSLPPRPSEVEEYSKLFNYDILHNHGAGTGRVTPQLHYVSDGTSETTIAMHPTGAVKVKVVDGDDQPIPDALVAFNPNQAFHNFGSQALGEGISSAETWKLLGLPEPGREAKLKSLRSQRTRNYHGTTNARGEVTISNLPSHLGWHSDGGEDRPRGQFVGFGVTRQGYRLVPAEPQRIMSASGQLSETVDLKPGETVNIRVRMQRRGAKPKPLTEAMNNANSQSAASADSPDKPSNDSAAKGTQDKIEMTPITVTGVAKDKDGKLVVGAVVRLLSTGVNEGLLAKTTTDAEGRYEFNEVELPIRRSQRFIDGGDINVFATSDDYGICWHGNRSVLLVPRPKNDSPSPQDPRFYEGEAIVMDLEFLPKAKLYGRVANKQGEPVADAVISLGNLDFLDWEGKAYSPSDRGFAGMRFAPQSYRTTKTDKDGQFEIHGLPQDTVTRVRIAHDHFATQALYVAITEREIEQYEYSANNITGIANGKVVRYPKMATREVVTCPIQIDVDQNRLVTINVVNRAGESIPDVSVSAASGDRATGTSAGGKTDHDGNVQLHLPPGDYRLVGRPPKGSAYVFSYDQLRISDSDVPIRQPLRLTSACSLVLKVVDADTGEPIAGVSFWRDVKDRPNARRALSSTSTVVDHPVTDENGILRVQVEPGQRTIGVGFGETPKPYRSGGGGGRTVECKEGATVSLKFEMRKSE